MQQPNSRRRIAPAAVDATRESQEVCRDAEYRADSGYRGDRNDHCRARPRILLDPTLESRTKAVGRGEEARADEGARDEDGDRGATAWGIGLVNAATHEAR